MKIAVHRKLTLDLFHVPYFYPFFLLHTKAVQPLFYRSNCHSGIKDILRQHYQRPYFLSNGSESSPLDWIFMGGSGLGAFIHVSVQEHILLFVQICVFLHDSIQRRIFVCHLIPVFIHVNCVRTLCALIYVCSCVNIQR